MISSIFQVILAIILVLLLLFIGSVIYNWEHLDILKNTDKNKKEIIIFDGIYDFNFGNLVYNTYSPDEYNYKELIPSINQNGGAEYSYSFWLKIGENFTIQEDYGLILLNRGSDIVLNYNSPSNCILKSNYKKWYMVKNPLIRLAKNGEALIVEYNTLFNPDAFRIKGTINKDCSSVEDNDNNKGLLGIYNMSGFRDKWIMITVVLQETSPDNNIMYKNETTCKIYLNDVNVFDKIVETNYSGFSNGDQGSAVMKHTTSKLYINPNNMVSRVKSVNNPNNLLMADLKYYNYSLSISEISNLFNKGFNKNMMTIPNTVKADYNNPYNIANIKYDNKIEGY